MKQINNIWFPDDDEHFINQIDKEGNYQRAQFETAMQFVKNKGLFIDVGAHVGLWTRMAHKAGFKNIISYEPNPKTFECLKKNTESYDNVTIYNIGISESFGKSKCIENHPGNSGAVSFQESKDGKCKMQPFQIMSFPSKSCFVKIDVEGSELDVIKGMKDFIAKAKPVMLVEQKDKLDAVNYLVDMGMAIRGRVNKDVILTF